MLNDKILAIAETAKFAAEESENRKIPFNSDLKAFAEKFAELMVEECIKVIEENSNNYPPSDLAWRCAMIESARVVKEHFRS